MLGGWRGIDGYGGEEGKDLVGSLDGLKVGFSNDWKAYEGEKKTMCDGQPLTTFLTRTRTLTLTPILTLTLTLTLPLTLPLTLTLTLTLSLPLPLPLARSTLKLQRIAQGATLARGAQVWA